MAAIHYVVYRLPAIAAILFYSIRIKVVQQLTCLTLGRPNGPAYSTGELLNTPLDTLRKLTALTQIPSLILGDARGRE